MGNNILKPFSDLCTKTWFFYKNALLWKPQLCENISGEYGQIVDRFFRQLYSEIAAVCQIYSRTKLDICSDFNIFWSRTSWSSLSSIEVLMIYFSARKILEKWLSYEMEQNVTNKKLKRTSLSCNFLVRGAMECQKNEKLIELVRIARSKYGWPKRAVK